MRHWTTLALAVCLTVIAATAWGYWSVDSTTGSNGAAAASTVDQGATPTAAAVSDDVTVTWATTTLANGQAVSGYRVARYDAGTLAPQTIQGGCTGALATTTCTEADVPGGSWRYAVTPLIGTSWVGAESAKSIPVASDGTAPVNAITLSSVTGGASKTSDTVYYRGTAAGSLQLTNALTDAGTGPASSATAMSGTATGWTHTDSTVATPVGGPYVSGELSWTAGTSSAPNVAVTGRDVAGNATVTDLGMVDDSTPPSAGTVTYADGFAAGRSVSVSFTSGTDAGSGIESHLLQRASAPLVDGICGTYGGYEDVGTVDPTSPYAATGLASGCYKFQYVVTDRVGNQHIATSADVAKVGYVGAVDATPGLLSHWRLGEGPSNLTVYDSFTGSTGSALAGRSSDIGGGAWVHQAGTANAVVDAGRVRRNGVFGGHTIDYSNLTPSSANYSVEADLVVVSNLGSDMVGVIGRHNSGTNTFYMARWEQADTSWNLVRYAGGTVSYLNYVAYQPALTVSEAYRLRLEMNGSTLKLYVNGVETVTATDATITAAGRAGIMDGENGVSSAKSASTGIHLDNFQVTPAGYPRAADVQAANPGDYKHGVTLGVSGALASDNNTAVRLDGVNDHVQVAPTSGFPAGGSVRSTEMWFKTTSAARQVLFRYGSAGVDQEYGLWIDAGGASMTAWGFGTGSDKVFPLPAAVNNGAWHHVVLTYNGTALTLYSDGAALPPLAATRGTVMDMYGFGIGAVIRPSDGNSGGFFSGSVDEVSFYTTALGAGTVSDHYELGGNTAVDTTGPTGGSVQATGLVGTGAAYSTSTTLNLSLSKGTDPSGFAATGALLRRASASLTGGACGVFGDYATITGGTDPVSPTNDTVADQACHRYEYVVADTMGNSTTYTSGDILVDTTAPSTPTLTFSSFTNSYWGGAGSPVYYRSTVPGGFTTTASAADPASGIASYALPALGTGWTSTPGASGVTTYSWSAAPAAPGTKNVTASNNASLTSANAPFTLTGDSTAPTAGTVSYVNGSTTGGTVSVSFTTGTDGGSGVGTRLLQRASAPLTGISCGTFSGFATVVNGTNPVSPVVDTVTGPSCYKYQYVVADRVGNQHTATSVGVAHTPYAGYWTFDEGSGTSAADSSGNVNHGTLGAAASWTTGKVGPYAGNLTGVGTSIVDIPNTVVDTSTSYSVAAWVRPSNLSGIRSLVSIDGSSISPFYLQTVNGQFRFTTRSSDSIAAIATTVSGSSAVVGTWSHVAGVYDADAGTIKLYVNGVLQGSASPTWVWRATGHTVIGRAKWSGAPADFYSGAIDDVRLEGRALSAAEIAALAAGP